MRKALSLLLISIFALGLTFATPVSKEKARMAAVNVYINYASKTVKDFSITKEIATKRNGITTFYTFVFNAGGFVMISADDAAIPVLAYSHESPYREDITNPSVKEWLDNYSAQIEAIRTSKLSNAATITKWNDVLNNRFPKNEKAVAPLLTTKWGQGGAWDDLVPAGTPVGCVATAMAQIMNYWEYPETGSGWHSYTHPTYGEQTAMFFATTYDYANMPDNVGSDASALLSYHCGVAVNMNYAQNASGAYSRDATFVLANYFKYNQNIAFYEKLNFDDANWKALLTYELDNSRPILYSGSSTGSGGHAFICDGYNDGGNFHFNWGWDGYLDAHYAIGALNPGSDDFNSTNSIVCAIQPADAGNEVFNWVQKDSNFPTNSTYPGYIDAVNYDVAWAIGRDGSGNNLSFKDFAVTKDGGATWTSKTLNFGTAFSMINGVSADVAFIAAYGTGTGNKIIRTIDGGENWEVVLSGAGGTSFFNVVHFFNENDGFVQGDPEGGEFELYTTTDGGDNWTRVPGENIPNPTPSDEYGITGLYDAVGDNIWFTTNAGHIYKSTDKGYNWTKHTIAEGSETNIEIAFDETGMTGIANYFMADVYTKYKTIDGGETWETLTYSGDFYNSGLSFVPGTESMWVSVGADAQKPEMGFSYTTDAGATWKQYANYYKIFQVTGLDMAGINKGFAGTFRGEVGGGMWVFGGVTPNFESNETTVCEGGSVTFSGYALDMASSIEWSFGDGATPATSTENGPITVTYNTLGTKTIVLSYSIGGETYTETKTDYIEVIDCTSISETDKPLFDIYPNPSNGLFNIASETAGNVAILNAVGQVVYEKTVQQQDVINLKDFNAGVYFVRFKNNNKISTQQIVIQ